MGVCFQENNYSSIKIQFEKKELLIGLKPNNKLCELNAFLQCLCHIESLVNKIKYNFNEIKNQKIYKIFNKSEKCLTDDFKDMVDKLYPNDITIRKENVIKKIYKTEDSNKLLETIYKINPQYNENQILLIDFFLMRLHNELKQDEDKAQQIANIEDETNKDQVLQNYSIKSSNENMSIINDIFFGTYYIYSICSNCKHTAYKFLPFIYNTYSLGEVYNYKVFTYNNGQNALYMNKMINLNEINLYDCLYYDQQIKSNIYTCKKCSISTQHNFRNIIYATGQILTLVFNKNDLIPDINFLIEENIDITNLVESKQYKIYELIGIIFYFLPNRYLTYCKSPIDKKWYFYEDAKVEIIKNFQKITNNNFIPYMMFYQRKVKYINISNYNNYI